MRFIKILFLVFISVNVFGQGVIPKPVKNKLLKGNFDIENCEYIYCDSSRYVTAKFINAEIFNGRLNINAKNEVPKPNSIVLGQFLKERFDESYNLYISKDRIQITGSPKGVYYGAKSLQQLLFNSGQKLQCQSISDEPVFKWRGMHLDCSRHFFDVAFIKKYIDILALHKMNTFHWHLTDDQGWRIEIKKYPLLTQIGSERKETILGKNFDPYQGDGKSYGGFYTQEEIKEVVQYAAERFITVVPEIEMPGHAIAALSAYPQFSCKQKPLAVRTTWGISDDIFCSSDQTFSFLFDIMEEVLQLFPSKYIHIGGDEAPKIRWKECMDCQANIKKHKLKDEHELQSYFIGRIDSFLTSKGRKTIGWDEILEGGLAENAAVMSWRGEQGGIEAAQQKHNVVMSPGSHCYFDHYQGDKKNEPLAIGGYTTLKKVYSYQPIPKTLDKNFHKYVLGAQGNVWTEYMATSDHVMYMALPRLCALSEVLWSGAGKNSYTDFTKRLIPHFDLLKVLGYNYSQTLFNIEAKPIFEKGNMNFALSSDFPEYEIRYTTDGKEPSANSTLYTSPIGIDKTLLLKAKLFKGATQKGNTFSQDFTHHFAVAKKIKLSHAPSEQYQTGGAQTLINGIVGTLPWSGNEWLGWRGLDSVEMLIDLEKNERINKIVVSCLDAKESWIHLPKKIIATVQDVTNQPHDIELTSLGDGIFFADNINRQVRKLRIKVEPINKIPEGLPGAGEKPWLFCSEIILE